MFEKDSKQSIFFKSQVVILSFVIMIVFFNYIRFLKLKYFQNYIMLLSADLTRLYHQPAQVHRSVPDVKTKQCLKVSFPMILSNAHPIFAIQTSPHNFTTCTSLNYCCQTTLHFIGLMEVGNRFR